MVFIKILPSSLDQYLHSLGSHSLCREVLHLGRGNFLSLHSFSKAELIRFQFLFIARLPQGNNLQEPEI